MTERPTSKYYFLHDTYHICDVSEPVLILFRCTSADLIGRDLFDLIPSPEMRALARLRMNHIREKGDLNSQDMPMQRPDGSTFWVSVLTRKLRPDLWVSFLTYKGEENPYWHDSNWSM